MVFEIVTGRSPKDRAKYGLTGTILLGKNYVQFDTTVSLSNPIYLDVTSPHVILVSGKRGSGKCLHGDTLITLSDGSVIPIRDLSEDTRDILGLDDKLKIKQLSKTEFFSRKVDRLLRIRLRSGKEVKLTPEHPLLTIKGWKPAQELDMGSRIATPRSLPTFGNSPIPEHEVKLLAYLIAEGHLGNNFVLFSNVDGLVSKEFVECVEKFDSNLRVDEHSKPGCYRVSQKVKSYVIKNVIDKRGQHSKLVRYQKSSIRAWLEKLDLYGKLSGEKFIPKEISTLPKERLALFLNRLFTCDGSVYKHKTTHGAVWEASYASTSENLIRQVQHLLLRFGIYSRIRPKNAKLNGKVFESFELEIGPAGLIKFIEEIGFFGEKAEKQKLALEETKSKTRNPNVDTIPKELWELYKPKSWAAVGRALGYTTFPKAARESQFYSPSREKLMQIAIADNADNIRILAEADIFWDEIVSMELLEGEFEVYDLSVPEFHNFVANDIIVHNSYTLGVIAEGMVDLPPEISSNLSVLIFDTMGIFWTMKYPNYRDDQLLAEWGLKPKGLAPVVFVPFGLFEKYQERGIPADVQFALKPVEISAESWATMFELDLISGEGTLIERALEATQLKYGEFDIDEIIDAVRADKRSTDKEKNVVENRFSVAQKWGLFRKEGTEITDLFKGGTASIMDLSAYAEVEGGDRIKALVIGLVSRKILQQRMTARKAEEIKLISEGGFLFGPEAAVVEETAPLVWMMVDEAHEFLPREGETLASGPLVQLLREGRQPGISLVLATQQPGKIHTDVMTQADIVISHRLTAKIDIDSLNLIASTYLPYQLQKYIDELPPDKGSAILIDDKLEKIYPMKVRPRYSWHGGEDPTAIRGELKEFGLIA